MSLDDILITPLKRIPAEGGEVMHAIKSRDLGFNGFGEAYFSWVESGAIKAWKKHLKMKMNLVVPIGDVRFVFCESAHSSCREEKIGAGYYARLTVPPRIWFGFQGISDKPSLVLNLANLSHDPEELERKSLSEIKFNWGVES